MCNSDHVGFDCSVISDWKYKDTLQQNPHLLQFNVNRIWSFRSSYDKKCTEIKYNRSLFEHVYVSIHATLKKKR